MGLPPPEADESRTEIAVPLEHAPAEPAQPEANMLAHISMRGHVLGVIGTWIGEAGSGLGIEALMLAPASQDRPEPSPSIEYQLVYPHGMKTPWTVAGTMAGSTGLSLACLGMRFRLSAETSPFFECHYDIVFTDGVRQDAVPGAEISVSPSGAPVEAIRLHISRRPTVPLIVLNDIDDSASAEEQADATGDKTVRLRLSSPAFGTQPPEIRNASLIPAGPGRAMAVSFKQRAFGGRPVTLRLIEGGIVAGDGLVFDRDLNLVPGTDRLIPEKDVIKYRALAKQAQKSGMRRIAGLSVLCKSRAAQNFGHFLVEMFPKAWIASQLLTRRGLTYLVQQTPILGVTQDALTRIGINPFAITATDDQPIECESLLVIDGLTKHGTYQSPLCVQALTALAAPIPAAAFAKIYVSRHATQRPLVNQEAVEAIMRDRGFAIVDPGKMSLAEQISLFKGASTVVGPLGAALTNIAFCPRGSTIVALTAQSFPDTFFWFIAQHRGHRYQELRGLDVSGTPEAHESWDAGFTMSDEDLAFLSTL